MLARLADFSAHLQFPKSIFPSPEGSCEKIQVGSEIGFSCCPGDGKICAAKIGGIGMTSNGYPAFRERTPAT